MSDLPISSPKYTNKALIHFLLQKKLAFAIWSLPGEVGWQGIAQNDDNVIKLSVAEMCSVKGFVIAPFTSNDTVSLIRADLEFNSINHSLDQNLEQESKIDSLENDDDRFYINDETSYLNDCKQLIGRIKEGMADKVILSRIKAVPFESKKLIRFFKKLLSTHQKSMVFMYAIDGAVWIGASPEILINVKNNRFTTMALAGTKSADDKNEWSQKEIDEQKYVSNYIEETLKNEGVSFLKSDLTIANAGPVTHLQNVFTGSIQNPKIPGLIYKLHPTPAVCGMPKQEALNLIHIHEKHSRGDYTGYFGPVNMGELNLFVNLRSARLTQNKMMVYVGGGITSDSIAEKEWHETELKAKTLLDCYKIC